MLTFLYVIHIMLCLSLILIVLLQAGKGSGVGLSIGGGMSQTMFGGSGGKTFFMKLTTGIAVAFMVTCLVLAIYAVKGQGQYKGVMSTAAQPAAGKSPLPGAGQPAQPAAPVEAPAPAPAGRPAPVQPAAPAPASK